MAHYFVIWEIDLEANSAEEAAFLARRYQRPGTTAVVFDVESEGGANRVDLMDMSDLKLATLRARHGHEEEAG